MFSCNGCASIRNTLCSQVSIIRAKNHISDETLEIAAQLAVHFSKAKNSSKVPVDYTFKKNVKKPNGTKPGFVNYTNEKALIIDPNFSLIEKLIQ